MMVLEKRVELLKQKAMHYHDKILGTAMGWWVAESPLYKINSGVELKSKIRNKFVYMSMSL